MEAYKFTWGSLLPKQLTAAFAVADGHDHDGVNSKAVTVGTVADGAITNAKVSNSAAIVYSKLSLTGGIVNADINASAAIAWSKLATSTDISSSGTVTDLTISGETNGDVLYFNGTNWIRLAATSLPAGIASGIAASTTMEGGTYDLTLVTTSQTSGVANVTMPDLAGVSDTFALVTKQATLVNKTLTDTTCIFGANGALTKTLGFDLSALTAGNKLTLAAASGTAQTLTLPNATDTLVGKATTDTFTNKTLTDTTCIFGANGALTKTLGFDLSALTAGNKLTLAAAAGTAQTLTLPNATDTLVGKATTDTFTNKTLDCLGTGNVVSNVNAVNLDPITIVAAAGRCAVPFVLTYVLANQASDVKIYNANAPFKFQVIKAWSISTSADGGTWKLTNGTSDITNAVTVATSADDFDEPTDYTIANGIIAQNGSLTITPDGAGLLDAQIYVMCVRVD